MDREYSLRNVLLMVCAIGMLLCVIVFSFGVGLGEKWAYKNIKVVVSETSKTILAQERTIEASRHHRALENERWAREDAERENVVMKYALTKLFQGVNFRPGLGIQWNQPRLRPWTGILLFNADAMPNGRFTDKNGFVFPHHAVKGERAVFLGECSNGVTVFCLNGTFSGKVLTFKPWERFDRQGVLVYHF